MLQIHETGKLIRALRKQKDLTQEELAGYANIDVATLSKIENGHTTPKQTTFRRLLDVLNFNIGDATHLFMSKEEMEHEQDKRHGVMLLNLMHTKDAGGIDDLNTHLDKMEQKEGFLDIPKNMQWFLNLRSAALVRLATLETLSQNANTLSGHSLEEQREAKANFKFSEQAVKALEKAIELYHQALRISIPNFEIEKISEYYLGVLEFSLIGSLAVAYTLSNTYHTKSGPNLGIAIYKELAKSKGEKEAFGLSRYTQVIANLCIELNGAERFEEAIEYANEGIEYCVRCRNDVKLGVIINQKALAMCHLFEINKDGHDKEKAKEIKEMFRYAYYRTCVVEKNQFTIDLQKSNFMYWFNENIDGTPLE